MTTRSGNTVVIEKEPAAACESCGKRRELRPYGPNGARVCFDCAMKDPEGTQERMAKMLFGEIDS